MGQITNFLVGVVVVLQNSLGSLGPESGPRIYEGVGIQPAALGLLAESWMELAWRCTRGPANVTVVAHLTEADQAELALNLGTIKTNGEYVFPDEPVVYMVAVDEQGNSYVMAVSGNSPDIGAGSAWGFVSSIRQPYQPLRLLPDKRVEFVAVAGQMDLVKFPGGKVVARSGVTKVPECPFPGDGGRQWNK